MTQPTPSPAPPTKPGAPATTPAAPLAPPEELVAGMAPDLREQDSLVALIQQLEAKKQQMVQLYQTNPQEFMRRLPLFLMGDFIDGQIMLAVEVAQIEDACSDRLEGLEQFAEAATNMEIIRSQSRLRVFLQTVINVIDWVKQLRGDGPIDVGLGAGEVVDLDALREEGLRMMAEVTVALEEIQSDDDEDEAAEDEDEDEDAAGADDQPPVTSPPKPQEKTDGPQAPTDQK